jgi:hypothetical protein
VRTFGAKKGSRPASAASRRKGKASAASSPGVSTPSSSKFGRSRSTAGTALDDSSDSDSDVSSDGDGASMGIKAPTLDSDSDDDEPSMVALQCSFFEQHVDISPEEGPLTLSLDICKVDGKGMIKISAHVSRVLCKAPEEVC